VFAAVALLTPLLTAGCGGTGGDSRGGPDSGSRPELVVFAASSLGPALERYGERFPDADVRFSFAGSDELAAQIRQGVVPDVYAAANTALADDLHADGLVEKPVVFATNRLVVGVPADSGIDELADLEPPGTTIAIGDEDVPVGIYTREVLRALGPGVETAILDNVASSEPDVAGIVGKLTQGAVDAGFVYRSDVEASGGRIVAVEIPRSASPDVAYGIAATTGAEQPELARRFVEGLLTGTGRRALLDAGFGAAPKPD
jgi:molybdate transport system substrate-binding protein